MRKQIICTRGKFTPPVVRWSMKRKSQTVPDQALSIREIVQRYVKGIPVDVIQREGVYVDQQEHDLEKLNRMDFGDKAAFAADLKERNQAIVEQAQATVEAKRKKERLRAKRERQKATTGPGIGKLDNTMPVDTKAQ